MHRLPILLTPQATDRNGNQILNASQPMKLYIFPDGNEEEKRVSINMMVQNTAGTDITTGRDAVISGYLEPIQ
jgi:hypothetical protein